MGPHRPTKKNWDRAFAADRSGGASGQDSGPSGYRCKDRQGRPGIASRDKRGLRVLEEHMIEAGEKAPGFCLAADDGEDLCLDTLKGKWVVLYFYPKDNTSG